jgi:hypothetical protein
MTEAGVVAEPADAFTKDWIADDGRAYVAKYALDPARAIGLVRAAGGATVIAHPRAGRDWDLSDEQLANLAAAGLAGVEVWHPDHDQPERQALLALVTDLGLIPSGGSDDHGQLTGYRLGSELAAPDTYDRLKSAATSLPPSDLPPSGLPPSGLPPSGLPPSGLPPSGRSQSSRRSQSSHSP